MGYNKNGGTGLCATPGFSGATANAAAHALDDNDLFTVEVMDISNSSTIASLFSLTQLLANCLAIVQIFFCLLIAAKIIPWSNGGDLSLYFGVFLLVNVVFAFGQLATGMRTTAGGPTYHFVYFFRTWTPTVIHAVSTLVQIVFYRAIITSKDDGYVVGLVMIPAVFAVIQLLYSVPAVHTNLKPPIVRPITDIYYKNCVDESR